MAAFAGIGGLDMRWRFALNRLAAHDDSVVMARSTACGDASMVHLGAGPSGVVSRAGVAGRTVIV